MRAESPESRIRQAHAGGVESRSMGQGKRRGAHARRKARRLSYSRRLGIESLEERRMLSVAIDVASKASTPDPAFPQSATSNDSSVSAPNSVNADGRFVVFRSKATNLVSGYLFTPGVDNIFRFDRLTGKVALVSVNEFGTGGGNNASFGPTISADGNIVVFVSSASNLDSLDTDSIWDIYARNMKTGTTEIISGDQFYSLHSRGNSFRPVISADGSMVAFSSRSARLSQLDTNNDIDVYSHSLITHETSLVSVNAARTASGNEFSDYPVINADGRVIAFESSASDLSPLDINGDDTDVFARDLVSDETFIVSMNAAGTGTANSDSSGATISADGNEIAFDSKATNISSLDTNHGYDVYVRDLANDTTRLVSVDFAGTGGSNDHPGEAVGAVISADGNTVVFSGYGVDYDGLGLAKHDLYANLNTGTTQRVTLGGPGVGVMSEGGDDPVPSTDGKTIAFWSTLSDSNSPDANSVSGIFVRDLRLGTTQFLSVGIDGVVESPVEDIGFNPISVSADGSTIMFGSSAANLLANDLNSQSDVFVVTLLAKPTQFPGDYNFDGVVDAADYTVWRDRMGSVGVTPYSGADGDGNGVVDAADFGVWRDHFGETGVGAGSTEPGARSVDLVHPALARASGTRSNERDRPSPARDQRYASVPDANSS